jgi:hypothetical protein
MAKGKIEYLGLPYTDENSLLKDWRALVSDKVASDLTTQGRIIFA